MSYVKIFQNPTKKPGQKPMNLPGGTDSRFDDNVSCTHSMSTPLYSIRSVTSLPLPVMVPTFNVAFLN